MYKPHCIEPAPPGRQGTLYPFENADGRAWPPRNYLGKVIALSEFLGPIRTLKVPLRLSDSRTIGGGFGEFVSPLINRIWWSKSITQPHGCAAPIQETMQAVQSC